MSSHREMRIYCKHKDVNVIHVQHPHRHLTAQEHKSGVARLHGKPVCSRINPPMALDPVTFSHIHKFSRDFETIYSHKNKLNYIQKQPFYNIRILFLPVLARRATGAPQGTDVP
jgi:hypothetical protein